MMSDFFNSALYSLIVKEMRHIMNDKSTALVAIFFPVMLLVLFGLGINLDPGSMVAGLSLPNSSQPGIALIPPIESSASFARIQVSSVEALSYGIQSNTLRAFLYTDHMSNIILDGSDPNTASLLSGTFSGVLKDDMIQRSLESYQKIPVKITMQSRAWYNQELLTRWTLVPGSLGVIMTLVATLLTSLVIAKEYEKGTIESLFCTPMSLTQLYFAKAIPYFILAVIVLAGSTAFILIFYQVPFRGSLFLFIGSSLCFLFTAVNMGLCISITFRDQFLCSQVALMSAYMPSFMLSGFLFEWSSMPKYIQYISYIVPAKYYVPCLQLSFLGGESWMLFVKNSAVMIALGVLWGSIAFRQLHKRVA